LQVLDKSTLHLDEALRVCKLEAVNVQTLHYCVQKELKRRNEEELEREGMMVIVPADKETATTGIS
jgi:hypothetical protein